MKIQIVQFASVIKIDVSLLYRGIIAAEFSNRMEYTKYYVANFTVFCVIPDGRYSKH